MMFSVIIFYCRVMHSHSKGEVLEILDMNKKKCYCPISLPKPITNMLII